MSTETNSQHTFESVLASAKLTAGEHADRESVLVGILGERHACLLNQHAALVAALEAMLELHDEGTMEAVRYSDCPMIADVQHKARTALALAKTA